MACYVCDGSDFRIRKGTVRDDASLRILECEQWGLVTLSSLEHIRAGHYEESGMHGDARPSIASWLRATEQDDQRRFEMLQAALVNRTVLDFGCGAGVPRKAQAVAAEIAGVEPERRIREHWGDALALRASLKEVGDATYDVITAFHVFEHLADPRAMLTALGARLADRGRLVIEVPSSEDALLTLYDNEAFQRFTYWSQHLFLFNAQTLRRLAIQAGLRVASTRSREVSDRRTRGRLYDDLPQAHCRRICEIHSRCRHSDGKPEEQPRARLQTKRIGTLAFVSQYRPTEGVEIDGTWYSRECFLNGPTSSSSNSW
jgi:2-polyprenyl-3-methyl-5-hydroxy-6-metoxy-1,4-benzoquinol methylase